MTKTRSAHFGKPKIGRRISRPVDPLMAALRARRIALGLTQETLSRRVGFVGETIRAGETGRNNPRLITLLCWAEALGVRLKLEEIDDGERRHKTQGD